MPRNRMIRCDYWVNEQVMSCSLDARLLFIGLWNFCDDNGVHPASYLTLKAEVFPVDSITVEEIKKLVNELISHNLIREYAVDNVSYWIVIDWKNMQKLEKPTYRYPLPESGLKAIQALNSQPLINDTSLITQVVLEDSSANTPRTIDDISTNNQGSLYANRKERKENEKEIKNICEVETSPVCISDSDSQSIACTQVFEYWQSVMNHPNAKFDRKRKRIIKNALAMGYNIEQLKRAIDGCKNTPHNMGKNKHKQVYDDITLILRDAEHIERFMNNAIGDISNNNVMRGVI